MVSLKSTEKHLRESKSLYKKEGSLFERYVSLILHRESIPLLIDPEILRKYDLGQIDCSYIKNNKIYVVECKTGIGLLSHKQKLRLLRSTSFLAIVFNKQSVLLKFSAVAKTGRGHYSFKISNIKEYN